MSQNDFPALDPQALADTRDACHAYASVLGAWTASCRPRRKHWWQLSLRPSLNGVTTGVIDADGVHFELELDLMNNCARGAIAGGASFTQPLGKQTVDELANAIRRYLLEGGVNEKFAPDGSSEGGHEPLDGSVRPGYDADMAARFSSVWRGVSAALSTFRAGIPEETSPIMLWHGHFDLAMMWLPGEKIAGQDPANEEYSDKQMNIGFTFGDASIPEPYFYITAYPLPDGFPRLQLPGQATWHSEGFQGAVLRYEALNAVADPEAELVALWQFLVDAGRKQML